MIAFSRTMRPFIIAEIGNNHEGDFVLAKELVHAAADSGVSAVKFQSINPAKLVTKDQTQRREQLSRFSLSFEQFEELAELAKSRDVAFFSTPFDVQSANDLNNIQSLYKISSGDNTFRKLIEVVANFGKPTIISTGGQSIDEIDDLREVYLASGGAETDLVLMHCMSIYPTPPQDAQLWRITMLLDRFPNLTIGYSDHTLGTKACEIAVAMHARVLEKHFTLDKNQSDFRDHQLSASPDEMSEIVAVCADVMTYYGSPGSSRPDAQMAGIRRVAVAARDVSEGTRLSLDDLTWLRSIQSEGISAAEVITEHMTTVDLKAGDVIKPNNLKA